METPVQSCGRLPGGILRGVDDSRILYRVALAQRTAHGLVYRDFFPSRGEIRSGTGAAGEALANGPRAAAPRGGRSAESRGYFSADQHLAGAPELFGGTVEVA